MAFLVLHYGGALRFGLDVRGFPLIWWTLLHIGLVVLTEAMLALELAVCAVLSIPLAGLVWLPSDGWLLPEPTGIVLNGALTMMNMSIVALVCYAVRRMWRRGGAQPRVALIVLREVMLIFSLIAIYAYMSGQAIIAQDGSAEGFCAVPDGVQRHRAAVHAAVVRHCLLHHTGRALPAPAPPEPPL